MNELERDGSKSVSSQVLFSVRDVARMLQVSVASVYAIVSEGKIACHRVGAGRGSIRFLESDIEDYLESCRMEKNEPRAKARRTRLKHLKL